MTAALRYLEDLGLADKADWTLDDVAKLPEDLRYELVDGKLAPLPAPYPIHAWIARQTANALDVHAPGDAFISEETSVVVGVDSELRPDAVALRIDGADRTPVFAEDVLLVVEVVSRSSKISDRRFKPKRYAEAGIPLYWVIDPLGDAVVLTEYVLGRDGSYRHGHARGGRLVLERPWPVSLDLDAWTARRDRVKAVRR